MCMVRLTVKVGSAIEEVVDDSSATDSSARALKARTAAVRAVVNFIVVNVGASDWQYTRY